MSREKRVHGKGERFRAFGGKGRIHGGCLRILVGKKKMGTTFGAKKKTSLFFFFGESANILN